jgi:hypothetical protein
MDLVGSWFSESSIAEKFERGGGGFFRYFALVFEGSFG